MSALRSNASIRETSKVASALPPETNVGRYRLERVGVELNRGIPKGHEA
jgi:hypothetical protein